MISENINNIKNIIPKYWPIGSFIHHNPLSGFEDKNFKEGLEEAKKVFGGRVYMRSEYYVSLYNDRKINAIIFEKNLTALLEKNKMLSFFEDAQNFLLNISPNFREYKSYEKTKALTLDVELYEHLKSDSVYRDNEVLLKSLIDKMNLYELNDALFDANVGDVIQKEIIEYITRYLDEEQTTLTMYSRNNGMFETFKHYEGFEYDGDAQKYIEEVLLEFGVKDVENYLLTHLLRLSGWSGFIRYRSSSDDYYFQQEHPSSIEEFLAIILYYERRYTNGLKLHNYDRFYEYSEAEKSLSTLRLLAYRGQLDNIAYDLMEHSKDYDTILEDFKTRQIQQNALQYQASYDKQGSFKDFVSYAKFVDFLRQEEGHFWVKAIEDTNIEKYIDDLIVPPRPKPHIPDAAVVFCIDVRSEILRRHIEQTGQYSTYGMAGFLGIPISFIEFDKGHEQFLCPAVVTPSNIVFELPKEEHEEYKKKKGVLKTFKKVISDLKNNPYTPFLMVEAIGWIFGVKLFGKTFVPQKTEQFFSRFKPKVPDTTYTIDQLSPDEIEEYSKKLHLRSIKELLIKEKKIDLNQRNILHVWEHLVLGKELGIEVNKATLDKLKNEYHVTKEDYEYQKTKLASVGFELETQVSHVQRILKTMGLTKDFPQFVFMIAHNSISDNNLFESALDCGACGGNASLPNIKTFIAMANKEDVREHLRQRGIDIPEHVRFVPGMHNTTTDDIDMHPFGVIDQTNQDDYDRAVKDFALASRKSRVERSQILPLTSNENDMFIKSIDWSQTRPEWGLAGNMMAYVGNREATKNINLQNKVFLQSYDWQEDSEDVELLTQLYDGPLVVGEWINMEHYFSTVDNALYGAGSKIYHNVVSKVGVFYGNYSDLQIGLPAQTVLLEGGAYHEPIRLIVFLEAPLEYGLKAVEKSTLGAPMILNEWVRLVVIDKRAGKVYMFEDGEMKIIREM